MINHPYIKYGAALVMIDNNLTEVKDITLEMLKACIKRGLNYFSLRPSGDFVGQNKVIFEYCNEKNSASQSCFLAPNVISEEMKASNLYKAAKAILKLSKSLTNSTKISQSEMPLSGEFCTFSEKGNVGRGKPSTTLFYEFLSLIVTLTPDKPCLQVNRRNECLIPDLTVDEDKKFIKLFRRLQRQRLASDAMVGKIKSVTGKPERPNIIKGNFPNAPSNGIYSGIALLGAIGELSKDAEYSNLACEVLKSLKSNNFYKISYGEASVLTFNHYIIDLSAKGRLKSIVDSLYRSKLYTVGARNFGSSKNEAEYSKFDMFANRFLQLFNKPAFDDFLSFRAEYPIQLELLLETYFEKMENIDLKIVHSARDLGKWLNRAAYVAALKDSKANDYENDTEKIRQTKSKLLMEIESSIMAAKSGDSLLAQVIIRVGRLSGRDAPPEADVYMEATASGNLKLKQAQNLLMAFSRVNGNSLIKSDITVGDQSEDLEEDNSEL